MRDADTTAPYVRGVHRLRNGRELSVALAAPTDGRGIGAIVAGLADRLRPTCVAVCGTCAGDPAVTTLGDVVVADPVVEWAGFMREHRRYGLDPALARAARDLDPTGLPSHGEAGADESRLWLLERLQAGQDPRSHPARARYFPAGTWESRLDQFQTDGLILRRPDDDLELTVTGATIVRHRLSEEADDPRRLPFRVLVAPMVGGDAVTAYEIWARLRRTGLGEVAAVDRETATVVSAARQADVPRWLVVKGVSHHAGRAETHRFTRFANFAARASAEVLFALLDHLD